MCVTIAYFFALQSHSSSLPVQTMNESQGHEKAVKIATGDDCANVMSSNNKPLKIIPMTLNGETRNCCGLNPGERLIKLCE